MRDEGVLVLGSGNVVHNLGIMNWREQNVAFDWATRFNNVVKEHIANFNHGPLIDFEGFGNDAALAINTKEHYLPCPYILGAQSAQERANIFTDGILVDR